jgi:glycosyltransferase involved in cell wall biosynthesis
MYELKIAQLSTSASGGAALAAKRLNSQLTAVGVSSEFLQNFPGSWGTLKRLSSKVVTGIQSHLTRELYGIATPVSLSKVDRDKLIRDFDIVHIHNWYNLLSHEDISFIGNRVPLVFSMHDERLLTGGCHVSLGCENFIDNCSDCPAVLIGKSFVSKGKVEIHEVLTQLPAYSVITPSLWMKNQWGLAYPNLINLPQHIPNIIEHPNQTAIGLDQNEFLKIVFISANLTTPVKGLSNLLGAISKSDISSRIKVSLVGKGDLKSLPNNPEIQQYGELASPEVYKVMARSDLLVVPSFSENSPNVIAEAQLMGLPVLASNVGGVSELIENGVTGFLTEPDEESLGSALFELIHKPNFPEISKNASCFAQNHWNNDVNVLRYMNVYQKASNQ